MGVAGLARADLVREAMKLGPTGAFAALVWWELHELRTKTMDPMAVDVAVLVDRCDVVPRGERQRGDDAVKARE